jgi:hypothetical protein
MEAMERTQPVIRVVDIPDGASAEQAERLMNMPCEEANYLLVNVLYMEPVRAVRAFYRLSARDQAWNSSDTTSGQLDGKDDAARKVIAANSALTVPALIAKLAGMGIDRKKTWVAYARLDARGAGARLTG